jgi:glycolate oxidase
MDIGVPSSQVPHVLEEINALTKQDGMPKLVTTYGHIGDGNLHVGTTADPTSDANREITNNFTRAVINIVREVGGTLTAEHGPGFVKGMYVEDVVGSVAMNVLRAIKRAIDPNNLLNPGQMGLDFEPFGGKPADQFVKTAAEFSSAQKEGDAE